MTSSDVENTDTSPNIPPSTTVHVDNAQDLHLEDYDETIDLLYRDAESINDGDLSASEAQSEILNIKIEEKLPGKEVTDKDIAGSDLEKKEEKEEKEETENLPELNVGKSEDDTLGDGWKSYKWIEPNQHEASERGRLSVFGGRDLSLCTSIAKMSPLGIGIQMYFKFLQHLALVFAAMSLMSLPLLLSSIFGERFIRNPEHVDPAYFVYTTLANVGSGADVAFHCMHDYMDINTTSVCQSDLKKSTVSMLAGYVEDWYFADFSLLASFLDSLYMCVFVAAVFYFKRSMRITEDSADQNRTTVTDYSVQVSGFPPSTQKADIVKFFSEKFDPNKPGRIYDDPTDRVFCFDVHAPDADPSNLEAALSQTSSAEVRTSDAGGNKVSVNLEWWNDPKEEALAKAKNPEYYRKWKVNRDQKRKEEKAQARMREVEAKSSTQIPFYPVVNTNLYHGDPRSADLYRGTYVAEVTMAYKDGPTLRRYVAKQHLVRLQRRYRATIQMLSGGSEYNDLDEDGKLRGLAEKKLKDIENKLGRISSGKGEAYIGSECRIRGNKIPANEGIERPAVCAFVVFKHETSYLRCIEAYSTSGNIFLRRCQARKLMFPVPSNQNKSSDGDSAPQKDRTRYVPISVKRAPDPSDIFWENVDTTSFERSMRILVTGIITLSVLSASFGFSIFIYAQIDAIALTLSDQGGGICDTIRLDMLWHARRDYLVDNSNDGVIVGLDKLSENLRDMDNASNHSRNSIAKLRANDLEAYDVNTVRQALRFTRMYNDEDCNSHSNGIAVGISSMDNSSNFLVNYNVTLCSSLGGCPTSSSMKAYCPCVPNTINLDMSSQPNCQPAACALENSIVYTPSWKLKNKTSQSATIVQHNSSSKDQRSEIEPNTCEGEASYPPSQILECYCQETMARWFKQYGKTVGLAGLLYEDGDVCSDIGFLHYGASQLDIIAVFLIVLINMLLTKLVAFLAKWERHPTRTAFLEAQMTKTYLVLFINTAFVVLTVNSDYVKSLNSARSVNQDDSTSTGFTGFSALWYSNVGVSLTLTMCIDVVSPHAPKLLSALLLRPLLRRCIRDRRKYKLTRSLSSNQVDVDGMYTGTEFVLPIRMAHIMNTMSVTLTFSAGLPFLLPLAAFSFLLSFNMDRYMLLRHYKRPPEYTTKLVQAYFSFVPLVMLLHLGFSVWMYTNPTTIYSERIEESGYAPYLSWYTSIVNAIFVQLRYFFPDTSTTWIDRAEQRISLVVAVGPVTIFATVLFIYFVNFVIVPFFVDMPRGMRLCFTQLGWWDRVCLHWFCKFCCEHRSNFEGNPPFTEQYVKHVTDNTGRLIRSRDLAEEYVTKDEHRDGWVVVFEKQRRLAYKSKLWGTGGRAFGKVHDGTTPMFTYEMMLYYQGSSYTYSIQKATGYSKVLFAQKNAIKARKVAEMRKSIKLADEAEAREKERKRRATEKLKRRNSRRQSFFGFNRSQSKLELLDEGHQGDGLKRENILTWTAPEGSSKSSENDSQSVAGGFDSGEDMKIEEILDGFELKEEFENDELKTKTTKSSEPIDQRTNSEDDEDIFTEFEMKDEPLVKNPKAVEDEHTKDDEESIIDISDSEEEPRWIRLYDSSQVSYYYYENKTGETTWDKPEDYDSPRNISEMNAVMRLLNREVKAALMVQKVFRQMRARKITEAARLVKLKESNDSEYDIGDWAVMQDHEGNEYYVNNITGKAVWELPSTEEWEHGIGGHGHATHSQYQDSPSFTGSEAFHHSGNASSLEPGYDGYFLRRRQSQASMQMTQNLNLSAAKEISLDSVLRHGAGRSRNVGSVYAYQQGVQRNTAAQVPPPGVQPPRSSSASTYAVSMSSKGKKKRRKSVMKPDGTWFEVPG